MTATVTTKPYGQISETVYLNGTAVGDIFGNFAEPTGTSHPHRFADRDAAIAACVSYATLGYWTGELDAPIAY